MRFRRNGTSRARSGRGGLLAVVTALLVAGGWVACQYDPNISSGTLHCSQNGECPDGFSCVLNYCVKPDATFDGGSGTGGGVATGGRTGGGNGAGGTPSGGSSATGGAVTGTGGTRTGGTTATGGAAAGGVGAAGTGGTSAGGTSAGGTGTGGQRTGGAAGANAGGASAGGAGTGGQRTGGTSTGGAATGGAATGGAATGGARTGGAPGTGGIAGGSGGTNPYARYIGTWTFGSDAVYTEGTFQDSLAGKIIGVSLSGLTSPPLYGTDICAATPLDLDSSGLLEVADPTFFCRDDVSSATYTFDYYPELFDLDTSDGQTGYFSARYTVVTWLGNTVQSSDSAYIDGSVTKTSATPPPN